MAAAALLLEEELQNSMATSEEDAEYEADDLDMVAENEDAVAANHQLQNGIMAHNEDEDLGSENAVLTEDAEDEEMAESAQNNVEEDSEEDEDDEDEEGEGVGAVKIQPGLAEDDEDVMTASDDDDDDDDDGSVASGEEDDESKDSDVEPEVEWKSTAGEEEEEPANPNRCMYVGSSA